MWRVLRVDAARLASTTSRVQAFIKKKKLTYVWDAQKGRHVARHEKLRLRWAP
jgi:hypothetical protein